MVQKGITGKELIERWDLFDDDIFQIVTQGLQPYDKYWEPILPQGSEVYLRKISDLMRQQFIIESRFPGILSTSYNYNDWCDLYVNGEIDAKQKLKKIKYPDGTNSRVRARYETIMAQINKLNKKCSWKDYKLPKKNEAKEADQEILLNARYKMEGILELDGQFTDSKMTENKDNSNQTELKEQDTPSLDSNVVNKPKVEVEDPEGFMRSVQVTYVSETEIKIKVGNHRAKIFDQEKLGFKKQNSKIWKDFIGILRKPDHAYYVGKAHGANKMRKSSYELAQKRLSGISEKLVSFFNETYHVYLLKEFKVYELMPERNDEPGKYRFKFQVCNRSHSAKNIDYYNELPKKQLIDEIETLSSNLGKLSNHGGKDAEEKIDEINDNLSQAVQVALKKEWLNRNRAEYYLNPTPESVVPNFDDVYEK